MKSRNRCRFCRQQMRNAAKNYRAVHVPRQKAFWLMEAESYRDKCPAPWFHAKLWEGER